MKTTALIRKMAGIPMGKYRAEAIAKQFEALSPSQIPVPIRSKPPATFGDKVPTGAKGPILVRKKVL